jgi:hypothetical protein
MVKISRSLWTWSGMKSLAKNMTCTFLVNREVRYSCKNWCICSVMVYIHNTSLMNIQNALLIGLNGWVEKRHAVTHLYWRSWKKITLTNFMISYGWARKLQFKEVTITIVCVTKCLFLSLQSELWCGLWLIILSAAKFELLSSSFTLKTWVLQKSIMNYLPLFMAKI